MSFLILGNILDFPSVIYFQVHFYSNEDIFVCCLLMSNTSFESIIKLICKKKISFWTIMVICEIKWTSNTKIGVHNAYIIPQ